MSNVKFKFWTGTEMLTEGFFINPDGTVWAWVDYRHTNSFVFKYQYPLYEYLKNDPERESIGNKFQNHKLLSNG